MSEALYLHDAYLRESTGRVEASRPGEVVLDRTVFYPTGGGQPSDVGRLVSDDGRVYPVVAVEKSPEGILHRIEGEAPPVGSVVREELDWPVRYRHMRYHTCLHILSGVVYRRFRAGITGGQIYEDRARMDLSLPEFNATVAGEVVETMNEVVREGRPIHVRFLSREAAGADPALIRVARELLPDVSQIRVIDIEGFDVQADGGTHVASTAEVGEIRLLKIENKGARNKRLYLTLDPVPPESVPAPP